MIILLLFSVFALVLTNLSIERLISNGFRWGMILVTFIAAIHYNYGSDYMHYYDSYIEFIYYDYSFSEVLFGDLSYKGENGWLFLMYLVRPLGVSGFFVLVAFVSIFQGVVVYKLIKKYVPNEWVIFALFIYLFNTSLYVGSMSGLRQHLAMTIIGCAIPLIINRKFLLSFLIIFIASTIHKSSLIFIPFVFWGYVPVKNTRYLSIIYVILYIFFIVSTSFKTAIVDDFFLLEDFEHYEVYADNSSSFRYGGEFLIVQLLPYVLSLAYIYRNKGDVIDKKLISLVAAGMSLQPLAASIPLGFRILYYFDFINIICLPIVFSSIKNKLYRYIVLTPFSLYLLFYYFSFFYFESRHKAFFNYHSLFDLL